MLPVNSAKVRAAFSHLEVSEAVFDILSLFCSFSSSRQNLLLMEYERNALLTILHESNEEEVVKLLPLLKAQYRCCFNLSSQITEPDFYQELLLNIIKIYLTQGELLRVDRFIMLGFKQICFCSKETIWDRLLFSKFCLEELKLQKRDKISKTASETSAELCPKLMLTFCFRNMLKPKLENCFPVDEKCSIFWSILLYSFGQL